MPRRKQLYYILDKDGETPILVDSVEAWSKNFSGKDRIVIQTQGDGWLVSTVFLGIDYRWGEGPPLLFETMLFAKFPEMIDSDCLRASTYAEALENHNDILMRHKLRLMGLTAD